MGRIAKLLAFTRVTRNGAKLSDVEVDPGGGALITSEHMSSPGDDSFPLINDYVGIMGIERTGGAVVVGNVDPLNDPVAQEGEKRIYGRDPATGLAVNQVWLKANGDVLVSNDNGSFLLRQDGGILGNNGAGSFELEAGGDFVVNGATIDAAGNISSPTSVSAPSMVVDGKELDDHIHPAGTPPGNTGPNS